MDDEKILSIDADDENISYLSLAKHLEDDTERKKNHIAHEIESMGDKYLEEIERKKKAQHSKLKKLIPYILKHRGDIHDKKELLSYSFEDVQDIYNETKVGKKPAIFKFFNFLFNIE